MAQVLHHHRQPRRSLSASAPLTDEEVRERHLKHIAEITKDLAPPKSDKLNREQHQWLNQRMRTSMGKPWKSWATRRYDF